MKHDALTQKHEREIIRLSFYIRITCTALVLLTSALVKPFDDSGASALFYGLSNVRGGEEKDLLRKLALPFTQWDTIHFLSIARHGYINEQNFAFLPGAPGLLALSGRIPYYFGASQERFNGAIAVLLVSCIATCLSIYTPIVFYRCVYLEPESQSVLNFVAKPISMQKLVLRVDKECKLCKEI